MKRVTSILLANLAFLAALVLSLLPYLMVPWNTYLFGFLILALAVYFQFIIWRETNALEISESLAKTEHSGALFFGVEVNPSDLFDQSKLIAARRRSEERSSFFALAYGIILIILVFFKMNYFSPFNLVYALYGALIIKYPRPQGYRFALSLSFLTGISSLFFNDKSHFATESINIAVWLGCFFAVLAGYGGDLLGIHRESLKYLRSTLDGRLKIFGRALKNLLVIAAIVFKKMFFA
jgi:hypothetical protein